MTELKTLKDLHFGLSDSKAKKLFKEEFIIKELKQEAIKWVKYLDLYDIGEHEHITYSCLLCGFKGLKECEYNEKHDKYTINDFDRNSIRTFIKFIFNLTEEDLK